MFLKINDRWVKANYIQSFSVKRVENNDEQAEVRFFLFHIEAGKELFQGFEMPEKMPLCNVEYAIMEMLDHGGADIHYIEIKNVIKGIIEVWEKDLSKKKNREKGEA